MTAGQLCLATGVAAAVVLSAALWRLLQRSHHVGRLMTDAGLPWERDVVWRELLLIAVGLALISAAFGATVIYQAQADVAVQQQRRQVAEDRVRGLVVQLNAMRDQLIAHGLRPDEGPGTFTFTITGGVWVCSRDIGTSYTCALSGG